ncbi:hypothetical protein LD119_00696 [Mesoplasma sp. JKS002660]|uniref:hypothetical protein n=1 Tax=Mesoplasma whartonense TaxID=2878854 RepID=UPI002022B137|nr:hypothetical protein [Mesoplasma sp. JKS002660]MCL8213745.1 hypothetical protein [Mesoplasma sp. JKS002660]
MKYKTKINFADGQTEYYLYETRRRAESKSSDLQADFNESDATVQVIEITELEALEMWEANLYQNNSEYQRYDFMVPEVEEADEI